MEKHSLNGSWEFAYAGFDWKLKIQNLTHKGEAQRGQGLGWMPAQVPGDAHLDLMRAGIIDDPFFGRNADHCLWMEGKDWWYRKSFEVPAGFRGKRVYLHCAGLDTFATLYLNGERIGEHENMFTPCEIEVTNLLAMQEENEVIIKLTSPLWGARQTIRDERCTIELPDEFRWGVCTNEPPNVYTRKAAMSYGWDVAPRLLTIGIWKDVELRAYDEARIADVHWHSDSVTDAQAQVSCTVELQKEQVESAPLEVQARFGDALATAAVELVQHHQQVHLNFTVPKPQLWWPNGYGDQHLYPCSVRLLCNGKCIDAQEMSYGIRTVELVQEAQSRGAISFYFRVNGRRILVQGFNWTPPDAIFVRTGEERYEQLLTLLRDCGANMLRVIGIGVYEQDAFYRLCDQYGILIWQDFMVTNFMYPQWDHAFMTNLREEVRFVVRSLRNHACLALWCGDNEMDYRWRDWTKDQFNEINRELIPNQLKELDPERPYQPSSPYSPSPEHRLDEKDGHVRLSGDDHHYSSCLKPYQEDAPEKPFHPRFLSEVGFIACPNLTELHRFLRDDELWPVDSRVWRYHATDTRMAGPGGMVIQSAHDAIKNNGKPTPTNIEEFIRYSQEVQAGALVDWYRRLTADPEFGGMLFFMFADIWPQITFSVVDYAGTPKLAYWALKEAFHENLRKQREPTK